MIRRTLCLFMYDVLFQFRHGFYAIYLIISALYIAILFSIPDTQRLLVTTILVFADTSVLGLTFVGALLLLEKQQNILQSLFVTPMRLAEYLAAKILSLSLIALLASGLILILANGIVSSMFLFFIGLVLSSSVFILIGLAVGARVRSLNGYLFGVMAGTIIFSVPLVSYLGIYDALWLYVMPTRATLYLLGSTMSPISASQLFYSLVNLMLWNVLTWWIAVKSFQKYIIEGR